MTTTLSSDPELERLKSRPIREYAAVWARLVAAGLDLAILSAIWLVLSLALAPRPATDPGTGTRTYYILISAPLTLALTSAYFIGFWSTRGRTPGMRATGLRVTSDDGTRLSPQLAIVRFVGLLVALAPLALGFFAAVWDEHKRGWHDRLTGSIVVAVE